MAHLFASLLSAGADFSAQVTFTVGVPLASSVGGGVASPGLQIIFRDGGTTNDDNIELARRVADSMAASVVSLTTNFSLLFCPDTAPESSHEIAALGKHPNEER